MKTSTEQYGRWRTAALDLSNIAIVTTAVIVGIAIAGQSFLALAALAVVSLALLFPVETSLGIFALLVPFDQVLVLGKSDFTISWFTGAFAGATLVLHGAMTHRFRTPARSEFYWAAFIFWTVASLTWSIDPATGMKRLPSVVALFGVYIVAANFQITRQELSRVLLLAVAGGTVAASIIIFQFGHNIPFEGRGSLAVNGTEANPNELAASLILPASLALCGLLARGSRLKRGALMAVLVVIASSIFLSMSRGSLLALAAALLFCMFRVGVNKRLMLALVLGAPLLFLSSLFYQRLEESLTGRGTGRYDIWLAGAQIVKDHPIIGVGLANFPVAYAKVAGYAHVFPSHGYVREAHDAYLQVCAETGIIGLILFLGALRAQLKEVRAAISRRVEYSAIALEASCWGMLVAALSGNIQWNKSFWLVFILLALVTRQCHSESEPDTFLRPTGLVRQNS